jgi:hypothetical protein
VKHEEIIRALSILVPNTEWTLSGDDFADIVWLQEGQPKATLEQVQAEIANPTPKPEPTIADKLASVGLSLEELREALGSN